MFSDKIKYLRQSKQLDQTALAKKLDVSKQSISNWENGNILPSVDMLCQIADFFQVSTDYLLDREDKELSDGISLDVIGLTDHEIEHIKKVIDDLRDKSNRLMK
ncbi:MAG: helix-turn-helix transcriptional regulator [Clostridiales bacterium]|nr:helix-turn-helix transcriptional regulator [Clostridiales bacterium]